NGKTIEKDGYRFGLLGWTGVDDHGRTYFQYDGGGAGVSSSSITSYPFDRVTVILLANRERVFTDLDALGLRVAAPFLSAHKPIEDKDRNTTERMKRALLSLTKGAVDPARF